MCLLPDFHLLVTSSTLFLVFLDKALLDVVRGFFVAFDFKRIAAASARDGTKVFGVRNNLGIRNTHDNDRLAHIVGIGTDNTSATR